MNINEVIKYPLLSEKTYSQMSNGVYTFVVDKRTNRAEVKKVVEFIFDVKVGKVNIMNYDKKPKKLGKFAGFTNEIKKAVIKVTEGQINIFPDEAAETQVENDKPAKDEKAKATSEVSEAEKKAAAKIAAKLQEKETQKAESTKEVPAPAKSTPVEKTDKPAEEAKQAEDK